MVTKFAERKGREKENRQERGILWIEAAILLPVMFFLFLGALDIANFQLQRQGVGVISESVATALQQNPNMTATEIYNYVKKLGSGTIPLVERKSTEVPTLENCIGGRDPQAPTDCLYLDGIRLGIKSSKEPVDVNAELWKDPNWELSSPWLAGDNAADDSNPYYVSVSTTWRPRQLFRIFGGTQIRSFSSKVVGRRFPNMVPFMGQVVTAKNATEFNQRMTDWEIWCKSVDSSNPVCTIIRNECSLPVGVTDQQFVSRISMPGCQNAFCVGGTGKYPNFVHINGFCGPDPINAVRNSNCKTGVVDWTVTCGYLG